MEGRVPPAGGEDPDDKPSKPPPPPMPALPPHFSLKSPPDCHPETYVIQIPKNQIYRVPPPENAIIAERRRACKNKTMAHWYCLLITGFILVAVALIGIALVAFYFMYTPKGPTFSVARVLVKKPHSHPHKPSRPAYEISLQAKNPNPFMGISYNTGGVATLSSKGKRIAKGRFPPSCQEENSFKKIKVLLKGSKATLPKEIDKSMKAKKANVPVSLSLNLKIKVKVKLGAIKTWIMYKNVACKFKVNTLGVTSSRILSQKCLTNSNS